MSGNQLPEAHPNSLESSGFSQELPLSNEEQTLPLVRSPWSFRVVAYACGRFTDILLQSYADNNKYAEYMKHAAQQPQMMMHPYPVRTTIVPSCGRTGHFPLLGETNSDLQFQQLQQLPVQISPAYTRMPIPAESVEDPLYVNAKQYSRILKRREARAKLEAEYKLLKTRQVGMKIIWSCGSELD